jgi:hypothetical protein
MTQTKDKMQQTMDLPDFEKQITSPIAGQYDQMYWAQLSLFLQTPDNSPKNQKIPRSQF